MSTLDIKFVKCHPEAIAPSRAYEGDCGWDLYSTEYVEILSLNYKLIGTGIKLEMPSYIYGRISSRSGLAVKHGIEVGAGVIDSSYRNEIKILLHNFNFDPHDIIDIIKPSAFSAMFGKRGKIVIKPGDKIAQIIFSPYYEANLIEAKELLETVRNEKGFGSSN